MLRQTIPVLIIKTTEKTREPVPALLPDKSGTTAVVLYTLFELLQKSDRAVIIVRNVLNDAKVKVGNSDYFDSGKAHRVSGYLAKADGSGFFDDRREIYYTDKHEWVVVWER